MKLETIIALVMTEIDRAERIHPVWPKDLIHAVSILNEEVGETTKAVLDHNERKGSPQAIVTEAVHTAAMAIRFLKNLEGDVIHETK